MNPEQERFIKDKGIQSIMDSCIQETLEKINFRLEILEREFRGILMESGYPPELLKVSPFVINDIKIDF